MRRYSEMLRQIDVMDTRSRLAWLQKLGPEKAAIELDNHCPYCKKLLVPNFRTFPETGERVWMTWPDCGCDNEYQYKNAVEKAKKAEAEATRQKLWEHTLTRSGLIGRLATATFDSFKPRDNWAGAMAARKAVEEYTRALLAHELASDKNWLILYGNFGTGKSHLTAAVVRSLIDAGHKNVYFRVWTDWLKRIQASWDSRNDDSGEQETEAQIINELQKGDFVVIDDLDKRQASDWVRSTLYSVLNYRYNAGLPTALTFNYGPDDVSAKVPGRLILEDYIGRAVLDRVMESAHTSLEFTGPSFRSGR